MLLPPLLTIGLAGPISAQPPPVLNLRSAVSRSSAEFSRIGSVRELADGQLLVVDVREATLSVVQLEHDRASTLGRHGDGPGEYRAPSRVVALPGDSSLVTERFNGRWLLLVGTRIVATISRSAPLGYFGPNILGADGHAHVLVQRPDHFPSGVEIRVSEAADSLLVLQGNRSTMRVDTLRRIRGRSSTISTFKVGTGERQLSAYVGNPLATEEQAILFSDGWVAFALLNPYRIDWRDPQGRMMRGPTIRIAQEKVSDGDKEAALRRWENEFRFPRIPLQTLKGWPDVLPPFLPNALLASPDGRVVVHRTPSVHAGNRYDIVNRRGVVVGQLLVGADQRVVGFGARTVYLASTDADGIDRISQHPWP